ncbi:hypothetical protein HELRODRAFT_161669 [Helobdella robusta]|uniref:E2 domain-containing protein n=1 Tax=Helobdella robusta TaxID=6412 RepID=T1ERR7_HELRO|nr:hypothetical protein HELRODRAFT_161669 [Helobdella robusta]ESO02402.1 hypothetical protein HELRODRAFT_161669 [Helobdella robusta]
MGLFVLISKDTSLQLMEEWNAARRRADSLESKSKKDGKKMKEVITNRYQRLYEAEEIENEQERKLLKDTHRIRVQALLNQQKQGVYSKLLQAINDPKPKRKDIAKTLQHYIKLLHKERLQTLNGYKQQVKDDPSLTKQAAIQASVSLVSQNNQLHEAVALLDKVSNSVSKAFLSVDVKEIRKISVENMNGNINKEKLADKKGDDEDDDDDDDDNDDDDDQSEEDDDEEDDEDFESNKRDDDDDDEDEEEDDYDEAENDDDDDEEEDDVKDDGDDDNDDDSLSDDDDDEGDVKDDDDNDDDDSLSDDDDDDSKLSNRDITDEESNEDDENPSKDKKSKDDDEEDDDDDKMMMMSDEPRRRDNEESDSSDSEDSKSKDKSFDSDDSDSENGFKKVDLDEGPATNPPFSADPLKQKPVDQVVTTTTTTTTTGPTTRWAAASDINQILDDIVSDSVMHNDEGKSAASDDADDDDSVDGDDDDDDDDGEDASIEREYNQGLGADYLKKDTIGVEQGSGYNPNFGAAIPLGVAVGTLTVAIVIVVGVLIMRRRGNGFYSNNGRMEGERAENDALNVSPEEQHVASMQVNGYENPTYKYFERYQQPAKA